MTAIVFETPGLIDVRAFTTMGISSKPNSDAPIGQFGTGLKYAIAVLVRMGAEPVVWIGKDQYVFYKHPTTFRDKSFDLVMMRAKRWPQRLWRDHELPFTTEYGKFWKPWQAFRELEANTRDEGGTTFETREDTGQDIIGRPLMTRIVVEHPEFYEAWQDKDGVFLPRASAVLKKDEILEVFEGESPFLYYHGMRVYELPKPSMFTYNIVRHVELTEDRTLRWQFQAAEALGDFTSKSENRDFVRQVVTADDEHWESDVSYDSYVPQTPSRVFREVVRERPVGLRDTSVAWLEKYEPPLREVMTQTLDEAHPKPWNVRGDYIQDANRIDLFHKPSAYRDYWTTLADKIVEIMNSDEAVVEEKVDEELPPAPEFDQEVPF